VWLVARLNHELAFRTFGTFQSPDSNYFQQVVNRTELSWILHV
jgi:hypothetical protein